MKNHESPRVAVLVDTSTAWGRRLIGGITRYAREHGPWLIWLRDSGQDEKLRLPAGWVGEGIIARVANVGMARHVQAIGVPVVNISGVVLPGVEFPRVTHDAAEAGRLAAKYFLDRGFRHFAFVGDTQLPLRHLALRGIQPGFVAQRLFRRTVSGPADRRFEPPLGARPGRSGPNGCWDNPSRWQFLPGQCGNRAASSRPAAAWDCRFPSKWPCWAETTIRCCTRPARRPFPASIVPSDLVGSRAAALLDDLMHGQQPSQATFLLKPTGIITRQSTDGWP